VIVQFEDFDGELKTLAWEPTIPEGVGRGARSMSSSWSATESSSPTSCSGKIFNSVHEGAGPSAGLTAEDIDFVSFDHLHVQDCRLLMGTTEPVMDDRDPRSRRSFPETRSS